MRRTRRLLALLALALVAARAPERPLDRVIAAAGFQGVAVTGDADTPAYVRAVGLAALGVRNRATATWRWASVTKQLTALIVMQEVAAGHLALDAPVKRYWPTWPQVFSDEITVRDLLQHTSGLADPNEDKPIADGLPGFYRPKPGTGDMAGEASGFCAEHPRAEPHTGFHYNNCDFIVIGALLERITGKSYATLVEERIARPVKVRIGLFAVGTPPAAHVRGLDEHGRPEIIGDLGTYGAAGALYGSPLALYAFDRALIRHSLLDAASTAIMWTGDPKLGAAALGQWQFTAPLKGCAAPLSIVERRGQIGGVQIRNFILPDSGRALLLFTREGRFAFGEVWQGKGFAYEAPVRRRVPPMSHALRLGVNIDHVATVRNARGAGYPDPVRAALLAVEAGADGITAHLREDRRHITDDDIARLSAGLPVPLNFEMAATPEMLAIALRHRPHAACIVPEKREERTTEGGLDAARNLDALAPLVAQLHDAGIRVSLFIEPAPDQIAAARQLGAPVVELHTGRYAELAGADQAAELRRLGDAARLATEYGIEVHAGHGLTAANVAAIAAIAPVRELNIGHALIGEAIFVGLPQAIRQMRAAMDAAR